MNNITGCIILGLHVLIIFMFLESVINKQRKMSKIQTGRMFVKSGHPPTVNNLVTVKEVKYDWVHYTYNDLPYSKGTARTKSEFIGLYDFYR